MKNIFKKTKKGTKIPLEKDIRVESAPKDEFIVDVKPTKEPEDIEIVPEPVEEVEMYNGKKVIARGWSEINGVKHETITTEEGSTYTL